MSNLTKTDMMLLFAIILFLGYIFYKDACEKKEYMSSYSTDDVTKETEEEDDDEEEENDDENVSEKKIVDVMPFEKVENVSIDENTSINLEACGNKNAWASENFLPKTDPLQEDYGEFAPNLDGKNFVDPFALMKGTNQNLRNANQALRSDPQITKKPWPIHDSTIMPDYRCRQLEIGPCQ